MDSRLKSRYFRFWWISFTCRTWSDSHLSRSRAASLSQAVSAWCWTITYGSSTLQTTRYLPMPSTTPTRTTKGRFTRRLRRCRHSWGFVCGWFLLLCLLAWVLAITCCQPACTRPDLIIRMAERYPRRTNPPRPRRVVRVRVWQKRSSVLAMSTLSRLRGCLGSTWRIKVVCRYHRTKKGKKKNKNKKRLYNTMVIKRIKLGYIYQVVLFKMYYVCTKAYGGISRIFPTNSDKKPIIWSGLKSMLIFLILLLFFFFFLIIFFIDRWRAVNISESNRKTLWYNRHANYSIFFWIIESNKIREFPIEDGNIIYLDGCKGGAFLEFFLSGARVFSGFLKPPLFCTPSFFFFFSLSVGFNVCIIIHTSTTTNSIYLFI